jgi:hypothetical protein
MTYNAITEDSTGSLVRYGYTVFVPDAGQTQVALNDGTVPPEGVEFRYVTVAAGELVEMSQLEKDAVDVVNLSDDKLAKARTFDLRTQQIIAQGVEVPPASGDFFRIDFEAIVAVEAQRDVAVYPFLIHAIGLTGVFTVNDVASANNVLSQQRIRLQAVLQEGANLLEQIRTAADKAALDAIVDPR